MYKVAETATTDTMPRALYTAQQVRELDRLAIEEHGIPGRVLMKRAGRALFAAIQKQWPRAAPITIFCGSGNNAGDGYIVAGLAAEQQLETRLIQVGDPAKLKGDARRAYEFARQAGVPMVSFKDAEMPSDGVVVDALLGTGLSGEVRPDYARAIEAINASNCPIAAVDIPSGLCSDTGAVLGCAVKADITATFIGLKRGLFTGRAPAHVGRIIYDDLQVPAAIFEAFVPDCERLSFRMGLKSLGCRPADAHKGAYGHVLVIGGEQGMGGAALMAAEAAGRTGAGLVSSATRGEHISAFLARRPEIMVRAVAAAADLTPLLERASVVVLGPGLGQTPWSRELLTAALAADLPLVVDADGLNLLNEGSAESRDNWVLTPHPGEAARLLGVETAEINADRFAAVRRLQADYGGVAVLKGAGSLVASSGALGVNESGNPGMATGGMGDVLSGVIGGLLAQGLTPPQAAELGVMVHGLAADRAAQTGQRGMLATDLMPHIRRLLNSKSNEFKV